MEKLVDVVHFLHLEIHEAFGGAGGALLFDKSFCLISCFRKIKDLALFFGI